MADLSGTPRPTGLAISPVPTEFEVSTQVLGDGKEWVLLGAKTPLGICVFCVPPKVAAQLSEHLGKVAKAAESGLVVASRLD